MKSAGVPWVLNATRMAAMQPGGWATAPIRVRRARIPRAGPPALVLLKEQVWNGRGTG